MKEQNKKTLKIFWDHAKKYPITLIVMVVATAGAAVTDAVFPLYLRDFINLLSQTGDKAVIIQGLKHTLYLLTIVYLINWTFWRIGGMFSAVFETNVIRDLANTCYSYLHKHSFSFFANNFAGSLVKKVKWFSGAFETITDQLLWNLIPLVIQGAITLYLLTRLNPAFGILLVVWSTIFMVFNWYFTKYKTKFDLARNEAETEASGLLADTISNHNNVKLFNGHEREIGKFAEINEKIRHLRIITWNYLSNTLDGVQGLLSIAMEIGILYYGVHLWNQGAISIGDFILIETLIVKMVNRIWNFGRVMRTVFQSLSDASEMTEILERDHEIRDIPNAKELKVKAGQIEFVNASFNYNETRTILKNFNLIIRPDERVALIGTSGAGKTTLIRLLMRSYELTSGKVLIDGQNIAKVKQESLWRAISLVPQDPNLFHRSLLENIRYGRPDASDEEVFEAARAANCHQFISQLEQGYNTLVGERGVKLSGGERQRVAIARAILCNSPILVLDEATSSLDSESEKLIQEALANLMKDKTVIVIAHRLSTIRQMDRIIVIDDGHIIEEGSHDALIARKDGTYNRLWQLQAGGFIQ